MTAVFGDPDIKYGLRTGKFTHLAFILLSWSHCSDISATESACFFFRLHQITSINLYFMVVINEGIPNNSGVVLNVALLKVFSKLVNLCLPIDEKNSTCNKPDLSGIL
jgi:hypothetical protein